MDLLKHIPNRENREMATDRVSELIETITQVETQMMKALVRKHIASKLKSGSYHNLALQQIYDTVGGFETSKKKKSAKRKMVTVSFNDNKFKPTEFNELMERLLTFKYLKGAVYALEQRSDNSNWHGYHLHILTPDNKPKPSELIRDFNRVFDKYIDGTNFIQVDQMVSDNPIEYLVGTKKGQDKQFKQVQDKLMRTHYKIIDSTTNRE